MDTTERTVIDLINNSKDPQKALEIALKLALSFLESLQESECTSSSYPQASA